MIDDSIGLGENGPTHGPVEYLASLRAIPNLNVFHRAGVVEILKERDVTLRSPGTPSLMALSRQCVPRLRFDGAVDFTDRVPMSSAGTREGVTLRCWPLALRSSSWSRPPRFA